MQSATSDNTVVAETTQDLAIAMLGGVAGAEHIELRTHAVLANLTGIDPQGGNGPYNGGPFARSIKSIRVRALRALAVL